MKIQFTADSTGCPNGYVAVKYRKGEVIEGDESYLHNFIQEGTAHEIFDQGSEPAPDRDTHEPVEQEEPAEVTEEGVAAPEPETEPGADEETAGVAATAPVVSEPVKGSKKQGKQP